MINLFKEKKEIAKFLIVGFSGVFVNMFFLWIFRDIFHLSLGISGVIAIEISVISNFLLNNAWTFWDRKQHATHIKFLRYHLSIFIGIAMNYSILLFLSQIIGIHYLISNLIGIGCATIINYTLSSRWAWKN